MKSSFSPSINIKRDFDTDFDYISTTNAERVIDSLNTNILSGTRSFHLIGSYGTGKSSFLLALEKQLLGSKKKFFHTEIKFNGKTHYHPLNLIGDFRSIDDALREELGINSKKDLINELNRYYSIVSSGGKGLFLAIDEFGKYLEYAAKNSPEKELYVLQKLAEYANDNKKNIILLTTLHQNVDAYGFELSSKQRNEWNKVKGRYKEIAFNEPVEQLLYLAANKLKNENKKVSKSFKPLYNAIVNSRIYPLKNILSEELSRQLYPLDILSSGILAAALKKYGQNERSLFTFLYNSDLTKKNYTGTTYFNLSDIYDYLINNYYSFLFSKVNDDFFKWSIIKNSLDRVEIFFEKDFYKSAELIKAIGLLNIFSPKGARLNRRFLQEYGKYALSIDNPAKYLKELEAAKIVKHQNYSDSFVLFEGTDLDIDLALRQAEGKISYSENVAISINQYFDFSVKPAKAVYIERGTPRFFEYVISEEPIKSIPKGEIDGYINLIFNENLDEKDVIAYSKKEDGPILFVLYSNTKKIKTFLNEIEKIELVLKENNEDRVASRELKSLKENAIDNLNNLVVNNLYGNSEIKWFYRGKEKYVNNIKEFNKLLSIVSNDIYFNTPVFQNELVNRDKLPATITTARKKLFERLFEDSNVEDIGYPENAFPPDKTIYLSLLKATGIHKQVNGNWEFGEPAEKSFKHLWNVCEKWFNDCKSNKKSLNELVEILLQKPFKLKQGFLDFWIPIYLFIRREDYALYDNEVFQASLNQDLIDYIIRYPKNIYIKSFDIQGVKLDLFNKYRSLINRLNEDKITNQTFIDTIRPFLTFYRSLPEYTKRTLRLTETAIRFRDAISIAKDPEKIFFEDFPQALGYSSIKLYKSEKYLEDYVQQLQSNIRELRTCYDELINRIEEYLLKITGQSKKNFEDYKKKIIQRFDSIKFNLLLPHQKVFYNRLNSELDDRKSWINSLVHALISKNLDNINDDEEEIIYEKMNNIFRELDNLCEFSNLHIDKLNEEAIKIELNPLNESLKKEIVRLPKKQIKELGNLEKTFRKELHKTSNKKLRKYLLAKLLNEELNSD